MFNVVLSNLWVSGYLCDFFGDWICVADTKRIEGHGREVWKVIQSEIAKKGDFL